MTRSQKLSALANTRVQSHCGWWFSMILCSISPVFTSCQSHIYLEFSVNHSAMEQPVWPIFPHWRGILYVPDILNLNGSFRAPQKSNFGSWMKNRTILKCIYQLSVFDDTVPWYKRPIVLFPLFILLDHGFESFAPINISLILSIWQKDVLWKVEFFW